MQLMVRLRAAKYLTMLIISLMIVPYLGCGVLAANSNKEVQTLVLFPLDDSIKSTASPKVVAALDGFLEEALSSYKGYRVVAYEERLPAIQRLVAMQPEKKPDTVGPFSTDSVAVSHAAMLGKAIASDLVVIGNVSKYLYDETAGTTEITASIELLDGATGKSIRPIMVSGRAAKAAGVDTANEAYLSSEAVKDAGRKIYEDITGEKYTEPDKNAASGNKGKKKSWIPMLLLSLGVGLLLSGGSGGSSSGSTGPENPPPPPL